MASDLETSSKFDPQCVKELSDAVDAWLIAQDDDGRRVAQLRIDNVLLAFDTLPSSLLNALLAVA
jgi:hypothetical protein